MDKNDDGIMAALTAILAIALLALLAWNQNRFTPLYVPITYTSEQRLTTQLIELAQKYGDKSDPAAIYERTMLYNNVYEPEFRLPREALKEGQVIYVHLLVERGAQLEKEKCR